MSKNLKISLCLLALSVVGNSGVSATHAAVGVPNTWKATPPVIAKQIASPHAEPLVSYSVPPFLPAEIKGAYGLSSLNLANTTGAGITVAIVDAYGDMNSNLTDTAQNDLQSFCATAGLPYNGPGSASPTLTEAFPDGQPTTYNPDWELETSLDIEWVHGIAPGANILLVVSPDNGSSLYDAILYAESHASIVSMSWGGGEYSGETATDATYFTTPGVAYFASTGDTGEGVEYPSASPDVTAVGGTTLQISSTDQWLTEVGWNGSVGGISLDEPYASFQAPWVASGNREVPDISADADPDTGVYVIENRASLQVGGTSLACPLWAGITAVLDGNLPLPIGEPTLHSDLYQFGDPGNLDTNFHDIVSGSNVNYSAVAGYDLVTGIGSPILNELLPAVLGSSSGPSCYTAWSSTAVYVAGNQASYDGENYQANYWNQNSNPSTNNGGAGSGEPWTAVGTCGVSNICSAVSAAPTGLAASSTSSTSTILSWNAVSAPPNCSISSYTIYSAGAPVASGITGTSYTIDNLSPSTTYTYTVAAVDAYGVSQQSSAITVTTPANLCTIAPAAPTGLAVGSISPTSATITWNAVTAPSNCTLTNYFVADGGFAEGSNPGVSSYTFTGLLPSTTYTFTIWAADVAGTSSPSTITATTPAAQCTTLPATPTGLTVTSLTSTSATVTWNAVTAPPNCTITNYFESKGTYSEGSNPALTTYTFSGLTPSTTYTLSVWSGDLAGQSSAPATVTITTPASGSGNCANIPAWSADGVYYAAGTLVSYNGSEYKCLQSHTSQVGWDPADVPALWSLVGSC